MKNTFKIAVAFVLSLIIVSCTKDDDNPIDKFTKNVNAKLFSDIEIGNSEYILPYASEDAHIEFEFEGTGSKVTKIMLNTLPLNVSKVEANEVKWELNHTVPAKYYQGQVNPHLHYHIHYEKNAAGKSIKPAVGTYLFKITITHEDGSISAITKKVTVVKKFKNVEVKVMEEGDHDGHEHRKTEEHHHKELHIDYEYDAGNNTVTKIEHVLVFKEWRTGQSVAVGKKNKLSVVVPEAKFKGAKNPHIHEHIELMEGIPNGEYVLVILVTESGQTVPTKLPVEFEVE